jgi:hypothetical protein
MKVRGTRAHLMAFGLLCFSGPVQAEALDVVCEQEDALLQGWTGPLKLSFSGTSGDLLKVDSAHVQLKLPAETAQQIGTIDGREVVSTRITASGELPSIMPEPEALKVCAAGTVQPEFKDDADMFALALMGCVAKTAPTASPLAVQASVTVGIVPAAAGQEPDVIIEIKRTYVVATLPSGGALAIETFPKNCKVSGP